MESRLLHFRRCYLNLHALGAVDIINRGENSRFARRQKRPGFGSRGPQDRRSGDGIPAATSLLRAGKAADFIITVELQLVVNLFLQGAANDQSDINIRYLL